MRIALLFEFDTLLGGERSMLTVVDQLANRHAFSAVAPAGGRLAAALAQRAVPVTPLPPREVEGKRLSHDEFHVRLAEVLRGLDVDLVHANSLHVARWTGALRASGAIAFPATGHLRDILNLSAGAMRDLNGNDRLVAVSEATRTHHVSRGLEADRTFVVHNGIDGTRFHPGSSGDAARLRSELGVPEETRLLLAVGQIGLRKGLNVLAEAVVAIDDPRVHLVLVGERTSTKAESVAFDRAIDDCFAVAGAGERLHRLGHRDDVPDLMRCCDLLVHAARQEPLGRVLLEAAASGLPIVATDVGGTREILDDASLVVPGDVASLVAGIQLVLSDRDAADRRAGQLRESVLRRFDPSERASDLARFWEGLRTERSE